MGPYSTLNSTAIPNTHTQPAERRLPCQSSQHCAVCSALCDIFHKQLKDCKKSRDSNGFEEKSSRRSSNLDVNQWNLVDTEDRKRYTVYCLVVQHWRALGYFCTQITVLKVQNSVREFYPYFLLVTGMRTDQACCHLGLVTRSFSIYLLRHSKLYGQLYECYTCYYRTDQRQGLSKYFKITQTKGNVYYG